MTYLPSNISSSNKSPQHLIPNRKALSFSKGDLLNSISRSLSADLYEIVPDFQCSIISRCIPGKRFHLAKLISTPTKKSSTFFLAVSLVNLCGDAFGCFGAMNWRQRTFQSRNNTNTGGIGRYCQWREK